MTLFNRVAEVYTGGLKIGGRMELVDGLLTHPMRVDFDVTHDLDSEPNRATISIWNLSHETQAAVSVERQRIVLMAGYWPHNGVNTSAVIFSGQIRFVETIDAGADRITKIECGDGDDAYAYAHTRHNRPATRIAAAREAARTLEEYGITIGTLRLGEEVEEFGSRRSHRPANRELDDIGRTTDSIWTIQDGVFHMWGRDDPLTRGRTILSASTGLVGAPEWTERGSSMRTLMLPFLRPGELVQLEGDGIQRNLHDRTFRVERVDFFGSNDTTDPFGSHITTRLFQAGKVKRSSQQYVGDST